MHPATTDSLQGPHEHNYHVQRMSGITQQTRRLDRNKTYGEIKRSVASRGIKARLMDMMSSCTDKSCNFWGREARRPGSAMGSLLCGVQYFGDVLVAGRLTKLVNDLVLSDLG